jgi:hypothetical protein
LRTEPRKNLRKLAPGALRVSKIFGLHPLGGSFHGIMRPKNKVAENIVVDDYTLGTVALVKVLNTLSNLLKDVTMSSTDHRAVRESA